MFINGLGYQVTMSKLYKIVAIALHCSLKIELQKLQTHYKLPRHDRLINCSQSWLQKSSKLEHRQTIDDRKNKLGRHE
jgi:hypothetical protein